MLSEAEYDIIIVVKDTIDVKNIYECSSFFHKLFRGKKIMIYTAIDISKEKFTAEFESYDIEIQIYPTNMIQRYVYFIEGIKRISHYLVQSSKSTSALQKLLEAFKMPRKIAYNAVITNMSPTRVKDYTDSQSFLEKTKTKKLCILMRSDSIHNKLFYKKNLNYLFVNFIRNIDALFLKGPPTVQSKYALNRFEFLTKNIEYIKGFGEVVSIKENEVMTTKSSEKVILYCHSNPKFFPNEINFLDKLLSVIGKKYDLVFRLNEATPRETETFLENKNARIEKPDWLNPKSQKGRCIPSAVITTASTVAIDYHRLGVKSIYFLNDPDYYDFCGLYSREHVQTMISALDIHLIHDISEISDIKI